MPEVKCMKCPKCEGEFELSEALFFDDHYKCPLCGHYFKPKEAIK